MSGLVRGSKAIAKALGYKSGRTVQRWVQKGLIPEARKVAGKTSPLVIKRTDLARLQRQITLTDDE